MPTYTYTCPGCGHVDENVLVSLSLVNKQEDYHNCEVCGKPMERQFPVGVHTISERSVDGRDQGKVIKQKNEKLKNREAGYSHEQKQIRAETEKKTQKIIEQREKTP